MRDFTRVLLLAGAFTLVTILNIAWYESQARAVNSVPAPAGALEGRQTYDAATSQIKHLQGTFWLIEGGAFIIFAALAALPPKRY